MSSVFAATVRRHPQTCYYIVLNCAVVLCFFGVNAYVLLSGEELVWVLDAQPLYVNFLTWGVQAFHEMVGTLLSGGGLVLPMYTYDIGYGTDVPMTFGSYLQDPLNLIALAFPLDQASVAYGVMTLLRMMLAANAFSVYCFGRGHGRGATGVAALAYVACGFVVFWGVLRHPKFMNWAILLPLILRGADKVFDRESPALFMVAMFLQLMTSTYYSYMSGLVLLGYCLVKYFAGPRARSLRDFLLLVARFVGYLAIAFAASAVFWVPQVLVLVSQDRAMSGASVPLLFSWKYYAKIAVQLTGADVTTNGLVLGPVTTLSLCVFALCGKKYHADERRPWLVGALVVSAGALVPFFGHVMNGMGYSTDRWMCALAFVAAYIVCLTFPVLGRMDSRDWRRVLVAACVVVAFGVAFGVQRALVGKDVLAAVWPLSMTVAFLAVVLVARKLSSGAQAKGSAAVRNAAGVADMVGDGGGGVPQARAGVARARLSAFLGVAAVVCVVATSCFYCAPKPMGHNWGTLFADSGSTGRRIVTDGPAEAVKSLGDDGAYRYSQPFVYNMKNSSLAHGAMGIDFYSSYYNQRVDDFRQQLAISDHHSNFSFVGSGARLAPDLIAGVKYFVAREGDEWAVPFGYAQVGEWNGYLIFRNENAVPLAFAQTSVISPADYAGYATTQRQEALLQAAVVDDADLAGDYGSAAVQTSSKDVPFHIVKSKGLEFDGTHAVASKKNATMKLRFDGLPDSETYVRFDNLSFTQLSKTAQDADAGETQVAESDDEEKTYPISVILNGHKKSINPASPSHVRYGGKVDWALCMGYSADAQTEMTVIFEKPGEYRFDSFAVVSQPVKPLTQEAQQLAARGLDDLKLDTNRMSATLVLPDENPAIAVFAVAFTPGWSVEVDGRPVKALNVDTAFCGVEVQGAGEHEITWTYCTPGIVQSAWASLVGLVVFLAVIVGRRFVRKGEVSPK